MVNKGEKPLDAIARHYLDTSMCPRYMPQDIMRHRKQQLADIAKEYKADGIIVEQNKFCEYWSYERTIDTIVMPRDFNSCVLHRKGIHKRRFRPAPHALPGIRGECRDQEDSGG